ncbi:hypothetical protein CI610_02142 [invertebrate metagenome]|uniref:Uncharacterized protein n=1 Tax=invertebrate metagenome TaxID=1711999 RepID=A0A2H9T6Q4_9ZZZZ
MLILNAISRTISHPILQALKYNYAYKKNYIRKEKPGIKQTSEALIWMTTTQGGSNNYAQRMTVL